MAGIYKDNPLALQIVFIGFGESTTRSRLPFLYRTLLHGETNYVSETDVLTDMEWLERGFEQSSSLVVTLS